MPSTITLELLLVWTAVGFFVSFGWHVASWIVSKILR